MTKPRMLKVDGPAGDLPYADLFDGAAPPDLPALPDGPVAVALAHNEVARLPDWLRHHRQIGVGHFIVIDNASIDGTGEMLDAQPDVTRLFTTKPYEVFKALWRTWPCDHWLGGRWLLQPDLDEHLVYPGWPDVPLPRLIDHWQGRGYGGVFAPMIDMYADRPIAEVAFNEDGRLLDAFPLFDGEGYWIAPPKRSSLAVLPTPPMLLFGGARTRLGRRGARSARDRVETLLRRHLMDWRNPAHPRPGARKAHEWLTRSRTGAGGTKSKVALIRWERGIRFPGANHRISKDIPLAPDWAAILHFRLMPDYVARENAWNIRKARTDADERNRYHQAAEQADPVWEGTRRLNSWRDLRDAGLIRVSDELAAALGAVAL